MKNTLLNHSRLVGGMMLLSFGLSACPTTPIRPPTQLCVQVPPTLSTHDQKIAADIAAKLEQIPVDASLKANFDNATRAEWGKLSDANVELFIFLQAIDCYANAKRPTPIGAEMARELMAIVRQRYGQTEGITTFGASTKGLSGSRTLSRAEKAALDRSNDGRQSIEIYKKYGIH